MVLPNAAVYLVTMAEYRLLFNIYLNLLINSVLVARDWPTLAKTALSRLLVSSNSAAHVKQDDNHESARLHSIFLNFEIKLFRPFQRLTNNEY